MASTLQNIRTYLEGLSVFPFDVTTQVFYGAYDATTFPLMLISDMDQVTEMETDGVAYTTSTFTVTIAATTLDEAENLSAQVDPFFAFQQITPTTMNCLPEGETVPKVPFYRFQKSRGYTLFEDPAA